MSTYDPTYLAIIKSQMGLSMRELAHLAGVNERRVRAWLSGESNPSTAAIEKITAAHQQFHTQVGHRLAQLLRTRTRPIRLEPTTPDDVPVLAAVATILTYREIPHVIGSTPP